jgi:hypothetical protein
MSHPHDYPINPNTISGGLGLADSYYDELSQETKEAYKEEDTVSDTLLNVGNRVRKEELDTPGALTRYERKILLAGYLVGTLHSQARIKALKLGAMDSALGDLLKKLKGSMDPDSEGG